MDNETEVIKHQMLETRTALTEKLEALEDRVVSTVKDTTEAVEETVEAVKDAVEETVGAVKGTVTETVETVKESVKETFDLKHQFAERPWMMLGGAAVLGYLGERLLEGGRASHPAASKGWAPIEGHNGRPEERIRPPGPAPSGPSLWDKAFVALAPAIEKLEGLAIGATTAVVGKMVLEAAPEAMRGDLEGVLNDITTALGGKPIPDLQRPEDGRSPAAAQPARG